ncbi:response regulator [Alicyclobacillus fastidiosus]|uniref:Response regulator transcription factor n=1 Tax=Alicyclobacillus fastidiosus TaxID=392011 RepID=A0ABV5ALG7_9BACL|nr:response regulator transcription factor [Alicyclobacillus fastidiosus]WEH08002.1 response regulator transcription factor [Alicyclobacillus fastidiosus]
MIRVLIVDDQRLMREGLRTLLELEDEISVVGVASDGKEAIAALIHQPDVILMDIRMPNVDGITATREVLLRQPDIKVLMLTTYDDQADVVGALSAGAVGYLLKDMPAESIAQGIREAARGGAILPPTVAKTFLSAVHQQAGAVEPVAPVPEPDMTELLTDRETQVLNCLAQGMSNREIGQHLHVTEGTVKNHVSNLIAKLDLRDRTQVALYAVRHGYGRLS